MNGYIQFGWTGETRAQSAGFYRERTLPPYKVPLTDYGGVCFLYSRQRTIGQRTQTSPPITIDKRPRFDYVPSSIKSRGLIVFRREGRKEPTVKQIYVTFVVLLSLSANIGCKVTDADRAELKHQNAQHAVDEIEYIKDARTNLCFAYCPQNGNFATVPCEAIPRRLLTSSR